MSDEYDMGMGVEYVSVILARKTDISSLTWMGMEILYIYLNPFNLKYISY